MLIYTTSGEEAFYIWLMISLRKQYSHHLVTKDDSNWSCVQYMVAKRWLGMEPFYKSLIQKLALLMLTSSMCVSVPTFNLSHVCIANSCLTVTGDLSTVLSTHPKPCPCCQNHTLYTDSYTTIEEFCHLSRVFSTKVYTMQEYFSHDKKKRGKELGRRTNIIEKKWFQYRIMSCVS